jgi:cation:H+ antiporter
MAHWILAASLLLILLGSEAAIRGGVGLARAFDFSPLVIGVLVIATATSLPVLFVSLRATTAGAPGLALGGIAGTSILNILFVMGLGALIHPMASPPKVVFRDGGAMLLAAAALILFSLGGSLSSQEGALLLAGFAAYIALVFVTDWRRTPDHSVAQARAEYRSQGEIPSVIGASFVLLAGIVMLMLGAHFMVSGSIAFAREWRLDETAMGLTVVAAGLSLPMLVVTLVAAFRGYAGIAVGQLIGAAVFNLCGVLGVTALVTPLKVPAMLIQTDFIVLAVASAVLVPLLALRWRLSRPRGVLLILAYGCYLAFVVWRQGLLPLP